LHVGLFYRPPDANEENNKFLYKTMTKFSSQNTIIMGDYNYGDINWELNTSGSIGKTFLKVITKASLLQCVKEKTRGENILDLIFVYNTSLISNIEVLPPIAKSDHSMLRVTLNLPSVSVSKIIKCFNYKKANYTKLAEEFEEQNWIDINSKNTTNVTWNIMIDKLKLFRDKYVPSFVSNVSDDAPWLNNTIKKAIKKRNNMFKRFKRGGQSYLKVKYTCLRNRVVKLVTCGKDAKKEI
jgi:hypothetical protein